MYRPAWSSCRRTGLSGMENALVSSGSAVFADGDAVVGCRVKKGADTRFGRGEEGCITTRTTKRLALNRTEPSWLRSARRKRTFVPND